MSHNSLEHHALRKLCGTCGLIFKYVAAGTHRGQQTFG